MTTVYALAMPDPAVVIAVVALVALVESSAWIRVPLGLLLAIALLKSGAELLPIALLGALGVMAARLVMALAARRGRDRLGATSPAGQAQRDLLRAQLAGSPSYARMTFLISALPGVPASFLFPLLGAMRAPLWPALAGTVVGRVPALALTTALFTWLGRIGDTSDRDAAILLGVMAAGLFVIRFISLIDWEHRAATGRFRLREVASPAMRVSGMFEAPAARSGAAPVEDEDVVEGEVLGEEVDDPDAIGPAPDDAHGDDDGAPPPRT